MRITRRGFLSGLSAAATWSALPRARADVTTTDVVVYGATPSGVCAAYTAVMGAKELGKDLKVTLVAGLNPVGGVMANGLCATDNAFWKLGGMPQLFFNRVTQAYLDMGANMPTRANAYRFEPKVAEAVFRKLLTEAGVRLIEGRLLDGVTVRERRVVAIHINSPEVLRATTFIDASYEGDLMIRAGCPHRIGRESHEEYGEENAGFLGMYRTTLPTPDLSLHKSPYDKDGSLYPYVKPYPGLELGAADGAVQAYTYRLCVTTAANRVPWTRPAGYDRDFFARVFRTTPTPFQPAPTVGDKYDLNGDMISGLSWKYPRGDAATRASILAEHEYFQRGLWYFLATDPDSKVEDYRAKMKANHGLRPDEVGLAPDEFVDNNNWPRQIYIREAARLVNAHVMTERDVGSDLALVHKSNSVAVVKFPRDHHSVQLMVLPKGKLGATEEQLFREGSLPYGKLPDPTPTDPDRTKPVPAYPYEVPYEVMVPDDIDNLLVSVNCAFTNAGWSAFRLEIPFMSMGEAAGQAAAYVTKNGGDVADVGAHVGGAMAVARGTIPKAVVSL